MSETQDEFAPDLPAANDDQLIEKIMAAVAKTTEEAIAPLKQALAERETPVPKGEEVGGGNDPDIGAMREQRAAYERSGLGEHMKFDDFIKGVQV